MGHYIVFTSGSCAGFEVPLSDNQEVFIGKDPALCSVVIDKEYKTVSRKHVGVKYSPEYDMYVLVDYSTNGTFVVGGSQLAKGQESYLSDGQSVNLGKTENVFRLETRNDDFAPAPGGETVPFDAYQNDMGGDYYGTNEYADQMPMAEDPAAMYPDGKTPGKGLGIAGMILGIISLVTCLCNGSLFPIIGLILSILGSKKDKEVGIANGKAKAGIIMNAIALAFGLIGLVLIILAVVGVVKTPDFLTEFLAGMGIQ